MHTDARFYLVRGIEVGRRVLNSSVRIRIRLIAFEFIRIRFANK